MSFYDMLSDQTYWNNISNQIEQKITPVVQQVRQLVERNQWRMLEAFQTLQVSEEHLTTVSTGYGFDDAARDKLENVYAHVFGTERAIVRPQLISGTHAIASSLYGVLRPGDEMVYITGEPYDTLRSVIESDRPAGERNVNPGSLADYGIACRYIPLTTDNKMDINRVCDIIGPKTKLVAIQRSRGYADRPSFTIAEIEKAIAALRAIKKDVIVFVDNCYGEFVEDLEPSHVGADIVAGSLIKNPGGGLAKGGGYVVGKRQYVEQIGNRLFAPGIGLEGGANPHSLVDFFQGFFLAPHVVGEALKGAIFASALLEKHGFDANPRWNEKRTDLIQSVRFHTADNLIAFCQGIQRSSPINAHVSPQPGEMPGYDVPVIMAAGTFIQGASIEFSADGPIRPPYIGYIQGGLTYEHIKMGMIMALDGVVKEGTIPLSRHQ